MVVRIFDSSTHHRRPLAAALFVLRVGERTGRDRFVQWRSRLVRWSGSPRGRVDGESVRLGVHRDQFPPASGPTTSGPGDQATRPSSGRAPSNPSRTSLARTEKYHEESSQRSRGFLYQSLGVVTAMATEASEL